MALNLRIPDDLKERLQVIANRERRSLHAQILQILAEAVARDDDRVAAPRPPPQRP